LPTSTPAGELSVALYRVVWNANYLIELHALFFLVFSTAHPNNTITAPSFSFPLNHTRPSNYSYAMAHGGLKYGGDLLAYAGDPDSSHAEFVVRAVAVVVTADGADGAGGAGGEEGEPTSRACAAALAQAAADAAAAARVAGAAAKTLLLAVVCVAPEQQRPSNDISSCGCGGSPPSPARRNNNNNEDGCCSTAPDVVWAAVRPPVFWSLANAFLQPFEPPSPAQRQQCLL
jgi:hypothetical protein